MTQQAAALQTYNNELVKCIEDLCSKRAELNRQIQQEEEEKERLEHDIQILTEKLSRVNESLAQRLTARATFDRTIAETEAAYAKILESSQSLLSVLKQEAGNLSKATEPRLKSQVNKRQVKSSPKSTRLQSKSTRGKSKSSPKSTRLQSKSTRGKFNKHICCDVDLQKSERERRTAVSDGTSHCACRSVKAPARPTTNYAWLGRF
ncbi:hypothetical protein WMY93_022162 [Mugilogobius chulae]|uniref:Uncharacterized protein n=1 Tax=Mugilogobius chulae TaxID=88201 RepID=A0AAW0NN78_9GOBI